LGRYEDQGLIRPHETQAIVDFRNGAFWIPKPAHLSFLLVALPSQRRDVRADCRELARRPNVFSNCAGVLHGDEHHQE
jgi:hypothetical protein